MMETDYPQLQNLSDAEKLFKARAKVVRMVHLYQFKFAEYFEKQADMFFGKIWEQISLSKISPTRECERLIFAIVRYLGECAAIPSYRGFMKDNL